MPYLSRAHHYVHSIYRVAMQYCRGPLPDGHPQQGVVYFCPDQDVATLACNLACVPVVEKLRFTDGMAVLLDAHRAPDEWYALACRMPQLLIQGDPDAIRPRSCQLFAVELTKVAAPPRSLPCPHLEHVAKLTAATKRARGRWIVLVGCHESIAAVHRHLRPHGVQPGDVVHDMHGRGGVVDSLMPGKHISVDSGRRTILHWSQHLVVSPSCVRAGEYDTVIVMPDVAFPIAQAVCRRARYMIIGVAHSPYGYLTSLLNSSHS